VKSNVCFFSEGTEAELFSKTELDKIKQMEANSQSEAQKSPQPTTSLDVRMNVIREIYHTELTYIDYLSLLLNVSRYIAFDANHIQSLFVCLLLSLYFYLFLFFFCSLWDFFFVLCLASHSCCETTKYHF
jgi:hypothetical protein